MKIKITKFKGLIIKTIYKSLKLLKKMKFRIK